MIKVDGENKKVVGFICECNPFHRGHKRLIKEAKKYGDYIVAVMSGNFVQRGEPAVYDKYKRTKDLIKNGVDLVIELPIEYVMSSAKYFAYGGVKILNELGIVDYIIFGSKIADIEKLKKIALINIDTANEKKSGSTIKKYLKEGKTYAYATGKMLGEKLSSNDILAVEYIRALNEIKSSVEPITIERKNDLPTASECREKIKKKITCDTFSNILNYKLLLAKTLKENSGSSDFSNIYLMTNDMENVVLKSQSSKLKNNLSFTERAKRIKTKNITLAYIKRLFFNIIFDIRKNDVEVDNEEKYKNYCDKEDLNVSKKSPIKNNMLSKNVRYIRVLGFRKESKNILRQIKIPILMSYAPTSYKSYLKMINKNHENNLSILQNKTNSLKKCDGENLSNELVVCKNKKGEYELSPVLQKNIFANDLYYYLSNQKLCEAERQVVVV